MHEVDLNCDLGEGCAGDAELMPLVTSANIACGGHAGDEATMRSSVQLALRHGVAVGAHPGFEDRDHFGRRELSVSPGHVYELIVNQTRRLQSIAREHNALVQHLKPHGALYNQAARDPALAIAIVDAVLKLGDGIVLFAPARSVLLETALQKGLPAFSEVFADRTYQPDGSLTSRARADALITVEKEAVEQVLRLIREGKVRATDGTEVSLRADTICVHGDTPHALDLVRALRRALTQAGIEAKTKHS